MTSLLPELTRTTLWLALLATLGGCVTATVQEVREADTGMLAGESIVVLGRRSQPASAETELDFISCVAGNMNRGANQVDVIPEQQFMDATFPWFEPRIAPAQANDLPALLDRPPLAQRLDEMGLKYLVWIEGSTERTDSGGSLSCAVTPAGGGCFGFLSWENDSAYEASVWDVESGTAAGRISSEAIGTSYMPAVIVPHPHTGARPGLRLHGAGGSAQGLCEQQESGLRRPVWPHLVAKTGNTRTTVRFPPHRPRTAPARSHTIPSA